MNATGKRGAARRAGAATGLASFAIVAGYWLLRAWAGDGAVPGAETVLVRSAVAAVAGFAPWQR